jgi:hypothetical protein
MESIGTIVRIENMFFIQLVMIFSLKHQNQDEMGKAASFSSTNLPKRLSDSFCRPSTTRFGICPVEIIRG